MCISGQYATFSLILDCCPSLTPLLVTSLGSQSLTFLSAGGNCVLSDNKSPLYDSRTSVLSKFEKVPFFFFFLSLPCRGLWFISLKSANNNTLQFLKTVLVKETFKMLSEESVFLRREYYKQHFT